MDFEWDRDKNEKNKQKHGADRHSTFYPNLLRIWGQKKKLKLCSFFVRKLSTPQLQP